MEANKLKCPKYSILKTYEGEKYSTEYDGFENSEESIILMDEEDNLVKCINKILTDIELDTKKYKQCVYKVGWNNEEQFNITYELIIYEYEDCGWTNRYLIFSYTWNLCDKIDMKETLKNSVKKHELFTIPINHKSNIKRKISNCKNIDYDIFKIEGNVNYDAVNELINDQGNRCHNCNDKIITHSCLPHCLFKFSIDKLNQNEPHNMNNVYISCYFCHRKKHPNFNKTAKELCVNKKCFCNNKLYFK